MSDHSVAELGAALYAARRSGVPIEPLTDTDAEMTVADAYRVQRDLVARLLADGDAVRTLPGGLDDVTAIRHHSHRQTADAPLASVRS